VTQPPNNSLLTYEAAGVSVEAGDAFAKRIKSLTGADTRKALLPALGGYAAVYPINDTQCVAVTTDGVGTKVLLADEFKTANTIGIDLVAMCANDLICVGATPTLFLDYFATGKLNPETGMNIIDGIVHGCRDTGMLLVGGETAEMPDVYAPGHFDLAGFAVGLVNRDDIITGDNARPGDIIIGLSASGVHSNGLSLARKVLSSTEDRLELLTPTALYVAPVLAALTSHRASITGLANITGGGWRNMARINPNIGFHIDAPLPVPSIFNRIAAAGVSTQVMYETFNMGVGFIITVDTPESAEAIVSLINTTKATTHIQAQIIGYTTDTAQHITLSSKNLIMTCS
jgi:phosphoribosylformylglycinamidine cyclo-ligase